MTQEEMVSGLNQLSTMLDGKIAKEKFHVYYTMLKDYSNEEFKIAINHVLKKRRNMPSNIIPDLLEYLNPVYDETDAEAIIRQLKSKMLKYGRYQNPELTVLESNVVSDCGGWVEICCTDSKNFEWRVRNLFKNGYTASGRLEKHIGLHEIENNKKNLIHGTKNIKQIIVKIPLEKDKDLPF